jgi:hypothetical protein
MRIPPTIPDRLPDTPVQYQEDVRLFGPGPQPFPAVADQIPDNVYTPAGDLAQVEGVGGNDELGRPVAHDPVPVVVVNAVRTREQPPLARSSNSVTLKVAALPVRLVGSTPQRRSLYICANQPIVLADGQVQAAQGLGLPLPANTVFPVTDTQDVWVANLGASDALIGFWQTTDVG